MFLSGGKAILAEYRGDWKFHYEHFNLTAYYKANRLCHMCVANKAGQNSFAKDLTAEYERRTSEQIVEECMSRQLRNPFTTDMTPGVFNAATQIRPCSMHIANLGTVQVLNGSVLDLLVKSGFFASTDMQVALHNASMRFKTYASAHRLVHSMPMLTPGMLIDGSAGSFPVLTLKAYNGRLFLGFLSVCLRSALAQSPNDLELVLSDQCVRALLQWYQLQESAPKRFLDAAWHSSLAAELSFGIKYFRSTTILTCD
ncbi:unnamed protein product [Symbiodinium necroappetens]|uniref:Uncharacterized protein n=1 Tax=Symbiodinium necroappetens TaxID=1628268 RepID=A0A812WZG9_9DINO|nr:unnamed protein product [Symbiodinium necroappetens]